MFRVSQHPSSGVLKTVTAASSTATSLQCSLIRPRWREVAVPVLWPVLVAAVTVFSTPDDGCCDTRNMYSDFAVNKYLHTVASGWIFINILQNYLDKIEVVCNICKKCGTGQLDRMSIPYVCLILWNRESPTAMRVLYPQHTAAFKMHVKCFFLKSVTGDSISRVQ